MSAEEIAVLATDELLWHPGRPDRFYVLPRHHDEVIARSMSFESLLAWAASSGDLDGRASFRSVVPLYDRIVVAFEYEGVDPDSVARALATVGDRVITDSATV
ncbi:MAG: hypothetical protein AB7S26_39665 [Sandaracinaceae bacterium]